MRHVMAAAVLAAAILAAGTAAGETVNPLAGGEGAQQIFGPTFNLEKARGRVIFFEYWGINCPPCRASYPHLVDLQKKYGPSGRFVVVTSHVQQMDEAVTAFLKKSNVPFPVYQQMRPSAAASKGTIPAAYLFDHTGKLVAEGMPSTLYGKVEALVRAAPTPLPDSPMTEGVEVKYCRAQAMALVPGKPAAVAMKALDARVKAGKDDATEAAALAEKARGWMAAETARLEAMAAEKPAEAYEPLRVLAATTAGLPEGKKPAELLAGLQKDPNVATVAKIIAPMGVLEKAGETGTPRARQTAANVKGQLASIQKRLTLSPALLAEVNAIQTTLSADTAAEPGPAGAKWLTNFGEAASRAQTSHKLILADFTGSDWCGWCIKLKSEVFDTPEFKAWASRNVILLEVDFPRRTSQAPAQKAANGALMQKYGVSGFPTILFLKGDGTVVGKSGYMQGGAKAWIANAQGILDAAKGK